MEPKIGICDYCAREEYNRIIESIPNYRKMSDSLEKEEYYNQWWPGEVTRLTKHLNKPVMSIDLDDTSIEICSNCLRDYAEQLDATKLII